MTRSIRSMYTSISFGFLSNVTNMQKRLRPNSGKIICIQPSCLFTSQPRINHSSSQNQATEKCRTSREAHYLHVWNFTLSSSPTPASWASLYALLCSEVLNLALQFPRTTLILQVLTQFKLFNILHNHSFTVKLFSNLIKSLKQWNKISDAFTKKKLQNM